LNILKTEIFTHPTHKQQHRKHIYAMLMHRTLHKARETKYIGLNCMEIVMHRKQMRIIFSIMQSMAYVIMTGINARLKVKVILVMYILLRCKKCQC
jgi:hypothetical protein